MMRERDLFLDRMRTLATAWVLMIHVLYILNFFADGIFNTLRSWLLLEMPLFFFITGAGLSMTKPRPWGQYVLRSWRRILIPYWCYALVCLLLNGIFGGSGVAADGFHIGSMTGAEVFTG